MNDVRAIVFACGFAALACQFSAGQGVPLFEPRVISLQVSIPGSAIVNPTHGMLVDLDGDGDADFVTFDVQGYVVVCLASNGTLGPAAAYPIGQSVACATAGDIDGDGDVDLVIVGTYVSSALWVYRNDGAGGFGAPPLIQLLPAGRSYWTVTIARMNADAIPDLFTSGGATPSTVLIGSGNGTFTATTGPILPSLLFDVADDDGDGDDDIHVISVPNVVTYRNTGQGSFAPPIPRFPVASSATNVWVRDIDLDTNRDFVVFSSSGGGSTSMQVALGNGSGSYSVGAPQIVATTLCTNPILTDADGDGDLDLFVVTQSGSLGLARNAGAATFSPVSVFDPSLGTTVLTGDLDGDGVSDVLQLYTSFATLRRGVAPNAVQPLIEVPIGSTFGFGLLLTDLNSDGLPDLVVSAFSGLTLLMGLEQSPTPQFISGSAPSSPGIVAADFNRDGFLDVMSLTSLGTLELRLGDGQGGLAPPSVVSVGAGGRTVVAADVNGDGNPDAVVLFTGSLAVRLGDGAGGFGAPIVTPSPVTSATSSVGDERLFLADLNGDGFLDAVVYPGAAASTPGFGILLGNGTGAFPSSSVLPGSASGRWPALHDVNDDGVPDLLFTIVSTSQFAVRFGVGDGTFLPFVLTPIAGPGDIAVADFDGDGFPDVMTSTGWLIRNDGTGAFPQTERIGPISGTLRTADVNADLQVDAVFVHSSSQSASVSILHDLRRCPCTGFRYGIGCPGAAGVVPALSARGCASPGATLSLDVRGGLGGASGGLVIDQAAVNTPVGYGCAALVPFSMPTVLPFVLGGPPVAGLGRTTFSVTLPPTFPTGVTAALQAVVFDAASPLQVSATNGVSLVIR